MSRLWVGWIKGNPGDKFKLRKLGVKGEMTYNHEHRSFFYCVITKKVMKVLEKKWSKFWRLAFSEVD